VTAWHINQQASASVKTEDDTAWLERLPRIGIRIVT